MNIIKKWIKDIATEPDGETICPVRIFAVLGFVYALVAHGWSIFILKVVFDLQAFGLGFGTMIATLGVALGMKTDTPSKEIK